MRYRTAVDSSSKGATNAARADIQIQFPMSTDVDRETRVVSESPGDPPPEVIDVDLLDSDYSTQASSSSGRGAFTSNIALEREPILVLDSDDERDIQFIGSNFPQQSSMRPSPYGFLPYAPIRADRSFLLFSPR